MTPRRRWTTSILIAAALAIPVGLGYWRAAHSGQPDAPPAPADPAAALAELRRGNARFVRSARTLSADTAHDAEHRRRLVRGQHPIVTVLCCTDSRVCPEFIFDQRMGSIFEIRNAGNVVDEDVLASAEYGVEHLHTRLLLVLGHKGCGAIQAVYEAGDRPLHAHLQDLQKHMSGLRQQIREHPGQDRVDLLNRLSRENARQQALSLVRDSRVLKAAVDGGAARLLYGLYDMETGAVEFFELKGPAAPGSP
jgi:carbonic anhydrase